MISESSFHLFRRDHLQKDLRILPRLPAAGLPSMAASPCDRTHDLSEMSFVTDTCVEHVLFQFGTHVWVEYNT